MPIYKYECKNCGSRYEVWQKITEEPLKVCEKCGGELIRLISQTSFILKGTGWYVTDYCNRKSSSNNNAGSNSNGSKNKAAKQDKQSESKPASSTTAATSNSSATQSSGSA